jgi:hypothetical protein
MLSSGPLPLDYQPNNFLADLCDFDSPGVKVAPPGLIHPDDDRCDICWGSLTSVDVEDSCSGGGAQKLSCGNVCGIKCLARAFENGNNL